MPLFTCSGESARHPDEVPRCVSAIGIAMVAKCLERELHSHRKAQVLFSVRGLITCRVGQESWIVPPQYAVWIPGGLPHSMRGAGTLDFYCVYVDPAAVPALPNTPFMFCVPPLLRELFRHAARMPELYDVEGADGRTVAVLLDHLSTVSGEMLAFPLPRDGKLRQIAGALLENPTERPTMAEWGRRVGAAERTLARVLRRETGMSFGRWRQQIQILAALQRLAEGATVQAVALDLGYESVSAFIAMFRKTVGTTPARYIASRRLS